MLYDRMHVPLPADAPGPLFVVMDLQGVERLFHQKTSSMRDYEASLTEILELLPGYINERCSAEDGLRAYLDRIIEDHEMVKAKRDGEILAEAAKLVGEYLIEQFNMLKMYHTDGVCHYIFDTWLDKQSPVFTKVRMEDLWTPSK